MSLSILEKDYRNANNKNAKRQIGCLLLEELDLPYKTSNNGVHCIIRLDEMNVRLDFWPSTAKLHETETDTKKEKAFNGDGRVISRLKQIAETYRKLED